MMQTPITYISVDEVFQHTSNTTWPIKAQFIICIISNSYFTATLLEGMTIYKQIYNTTKSEQGTALDQSHKYAQHLLK